MEPACPSALEICSDCNDVKKRIYFFHQLNARESPWYQMVSMEPKPNFQNKNIDSSLLLSLCVKTFFFRQISQSFLIWSLLLHAVGKTKLPWRAPMFLLLSMSHSYWSSGTFSPSSWAQLWWFAPDSVSPSTMVPTSSAPCPYSRSGIEQWGLHPSISDPLEGSRGRLWDFVSTRLAVMKLEALVAGCKHARQCFSIHDLI